MKKVRNVVGKACTERRKISLPKDVKIKISGRFDEK